MFCFFCGRENKDEQKFCKYCGKILHLDSVSIDPSAEVHNCEAVSEKNHKNNTNKLLVAITVLLALLLILLGIGLFVYINSDAVNPLELLGMNSEETNLSQEETQIISENKLTEEGNDKTTDNRALSEVDDKKELVPIAEEQKYFDEADAFLKQDDPLSAAQILTKAMSEGYYPEIYEKLKEIRRNTVDNNSHIEQYNEVTGKLIYEAWLETEYKNDLPVLVNKYEWMEKVKTLVSSENYSDTEYTKSDDDKVEYDNEGRISKITSRDFTRTYEYDDYGRIIRQEISKSNMFGTWITNNEYSYSEDGCIISGHDVSADGSELGYENYEERVYDALGGIVKSKSHWDEGEIYGGWAEWTHEYHYVPGLKSAPENPNVEEIWNNWPGNDLTDILYM